MYYDTYEDKIGFHLTKVKGAAAKGKESYRAVLNHDAMSAEDTLEELAQKTRIPSTQLAYIGSSILRGLVEGTLRDGRSRNFEGFVTTRLDIKGIFDRIDTPFDKHKHSCIIGLVPGVNITKLERREAPINETKPPRGRFDYITYPGGEKGFIKIGEEIHVHGHELKLDHKENYIYFTTLSPKGEKRFFLRTMEGRSPTEPCALEILENTDTFLRLRWPQVITPETLGEQTTAKFKFVDCRWTDHHDSFSRPVTILH